MTRGMLKILDKVFNSNNGNIVKISDLTIEELANLDPVFFVGKTREIMGFWAIDKHGSRIWIQGMTFVWSVDDSLYLTRNIRRIARFGLGLPRE